MNRTYQAGKIFTGKEWLQDHAINISNGIIESIEPIDANNISEADRYDIIAPAFVDIQIYGAAGRLLSVYPNADSLHRLYDYCLKGGAAYFQPTVATNSYEVFFACIDAVKQYWKEDGKGCIGLHIEGPWISVAKRGAHIESFIHAPTVEQATKLLEYGKSVITMITLAPEVCSKEIVDLVQSYGVVVSAGHSNANYAEAFQSFDQGIGTATHLYNAMSPFQHRAPGFAGAVLDHKNVMSSIVPDGYHVDFAAIRIAKKIMGQRLFAITDAVTTTTEGPYPHQLAGDKYESNGVLSGSALDMGKCLRNLVYKTGIELDEALRMTSLYPVQVMNWQEKAGTIDKNKPANLVFLSEDLEVQGTHV